jgi:hypothetical protein
MNTSRPITKLNAKTGLVVTSILYLVNAGVGTVIAVKENLPSMTFITSGKPALEDFLTGNGTALSPPLYLCLIVVVLLILAWQPKRLGMIGAVGLTILGVLFLPAILVERLTSQLLHLLTVDLPVALVQLADIVLPLLMIAFGGAEIVHRRHAHRHGASTRDISP